MSIAELRKEYHARIRTEIIRIQRNRKNTDIEYPNFADGDNTSSRDIAWSIVGQLGYTLDYSGLKGQTTGGRFERITRQFLERSFELLNKKLRPGKWYYSTKYPISRFDQFRHLADIDEAVLKNPELAILLGKDYIIKPDIVIGRWPVSDQDINQGESIIDYADRIAQLTPLRKANYPGRRLILHASISCKWTLRSDRGQNARTEALNLIRNRRGHLPHIVAVTAEPLPTRIASLALGSGDLDCVYHFAFYELKRALEEIDNQDQLDMLNTLIDGRRLRDISDLPFDLAA